MSRAILSQNYPNYSPPMPPVLNTGNSNSVIQQNIDSLKTTNPKIYEKYKNDPKTLVYMANAFLVPAKDPEMTALEELEAPSSSFKTSNFRDIVAGGLKTYIQSKKDALDFGNDYALDQRAKSLTAIRRAEKAASTTLFDDGNVVPPIYNEPVLYNSPEENVGQLSKVKPALRADFTSPMPTGARLDPYMDIPQTDVPEGFHRMPDGSIMPDSEMKGALENPYDETPHVSTEALGDPYDETPPVLREALGDPYDETPPALKEALGDPYDETPQDGVLETKGETKPKGNGILNTTTTASQDRMSSPVTANARGSAMPYGKVGRNEMLMRMGAKMMAGSTQGYGAAMDAAFSEYGNIQDANRQAETDAFNKEEATRLAEERIAALKAKGSAKDTNQNQETAGLIGDRIADFESGIQAIADSKAAGGNLTGVGGVFKSFFDNYTGDADAARRLLLKRLQVNDTLLRTAETKGAISNFEMALFKSPTPTNFMDEKIWSEWINARLNALRNQQYRLKNGIVLPESERSYYFKNRPTDTNNDLIREADALFD